MIKQAIKLAGRIMLNQQQNSQCDITILGNNNEINIVQSDKITSVDVKGNRNTITIRSVRHNFCDRQHKRQS